MNFNRTAGFDSVYQLAIRKPDIPILHWREISNALEGRGMSKNILIFADGTGQAGGLRPDQQLSNVYKLFRATRVGPDSPIDPCQQVAFYDPGIGTTSASGVVRLDVWDQMRALVSQAVGLGFSGNVIDCYEAILKSYEPGDRIYLFGFSRGGYTVRALANVLNLCGVPREDGNGQPLPRAGRRLRAIAREAVRKVYEHGAGSPRSKYQEQREELARRFRAKYAVPGDENRAADHPEFVGVFDAVAALGMPVSKRLMIVGFGLAGVGLVGAGLGFWIADHSLLSALRWAGAFALLGGSVAAFLFGLVTVRWAPTGVREGGPMHFAFWRGAHFDRFLDQRIPVVRHALAIDETRRHFGRVEWGSKANNDVFYNGRPHLWQLWFAGNHSDIGGSYAENESRLSDVTLTWMVQEATLGPNPILVDENKLRLHPDSLGMQHSEVFAAKNGSRLRSMFPWPEKNRAIHPQAELHPSVLARFSAAEVLNCDRYEPYRPSSLREHEYVQAFYAPPSDLPKDPA